MNKTLILFLVICIISAHAFVKRDAPEAPKDENTLVKISKQISEGLEGFKDQFADSLNPDAIKKGFSEFVDGANKLFKSIEKNDDLKKSA